MARKSGTKKQKSNILIVCEGETEKKYLNALKSSYRLTTVKVKVENAKGGSAQEVVDFAEKKRDYENKKGKENRIDEVYCVFDNDNKNIETEILPAIKKMKEKDFGIIYSNICFEMWLGMHYDDFLIKKYRTPSCVEKELKKYDTNFHKTEYDVAKYINNIPKALAKSKKMNCDNSNCPNTAQELLVNPYTNMANLIERLELEKNK